MDKRLLTIAGMITGKRGIVDVGTDHGYLPVYLAKNGYNGDIFATDINEGPLQTAINSAELAGVSGRIRFLRCDGLEACPPDAVDCVIIAGMGGDTICGILDRAEWILDGRYQLILQPVTKAEILRYWLAWNGFKFEAEHIVEEQGFVYQIFSARFDNNTKLSDAELFTGKYELVSDEPLFPKQLARLIKRFEKAVKGLAGARSLDERNRYKLFSDILSQLYKMREKYDGHCK